MNDLISRSALLVVPNVCKVTEYDESGCGISYLAVSVDAIEAAPTIDAEVVRHGRWRRLGPNWYECSVCKARTSIFSGTKCYCPNCGAKMDGDVNAAD